MSLRPRVLNVENLPVVGFFQLRNPNPPTSVHVGDKNTSDLFSALSHSWTVRRPGNKASLY